MNSPRNVKAVRQHRSADQRQTKGGVTFDNSESPDTAWLNLSRPKVKLGLEAEIFVGVVYLAPRNSTYTQRVENLTFDTLEHDVLGYSEKGKVILMSDLNARTGEMNEEMCNDKYDDELFGLTHSIPKLD